MTLLERKVNAIAQALLARDPVNKSRALDELSRLMQTKNERYQDVEEAVRAALLELGVPDNLTGYSRLESALVMVAKEPEMLHPMHKGLYTEVAVLYDTTPSRVERTIRHAIETCWDRMDMDTMKAYFGSTVSPLRGKPTNGEFIARVAGVVRKRMQGAQ